MEKLNLPVYEFRIKTEERKQFIFDIARRKYVTLTPEEWVRQHIIHYLTKEKKYPCQLIAVETSIKVNKLEKRCDIVLFDNTGKPLIIVECKAPSVKISQGTFNQIASYNLKLRVNYLLVTNGLNHFCCEMDYKSNSYKFITEIPEYFKAN